MFEHHDPAADLLYQIMVVRDYDNSYIAPVRFITDLIPDLCLCDGIKHCANLITDQKRGIAQQSSCHTKALQLPAGQLSRKSV